MNGRLRHAWAHRHHRHGGRLHRRIFLWFGATIAVTALVVSVLHLLIGNQGARWWRDQVDRGRTFVAGRFERVWEDERARTELASSIAGELRLGVVLQDFSGAPLGQYGVSCGLPEASRWRSRGAAHHDGWRIPVERGGRALGFVTLCGPDTEGVPGGRGILTFLAVAAVLWAASGKLARRLTRPLAELARVATELGQGKLTARYRPHRRDPAEVRTVAEAVNDMASRIERQLAEQRELLAAVSHELRTPLARIRLLAELGRSAPEGKAQLEEIDREVVEIDDLVGQLLASSRIDFSALSPVPLDAVDLARRSLERAGLSADLLRASAAQVPLTADATLLSRALSNLIENAQRHGKGLLGLEVGLEADAVVLAALDAGPGFKAGEEQKAFHAFAHRSERPREPGSLGLGLSLVRRIAEAHGGTAGAENRPTGGARVFLRLPRRTVG